MKVSTFAFVIAALALSVPTQAQTGAGTPPTTNAMPQNAPIPLKIILPGNHSAKGILKTAVERGKTSDQSQFIANQTIKISFEIVNSTDKPIVYNFPNGQQFDISLMDEKGAARWTWSRGRKFTHFISRISIDPGKTKSYTADLNLRSLSLSAGVYTLQANLTSKAGTAITGSLIINSDPDPTNIGRPTQTPADTGAMRQVDVTPAVKAVKTITIKPVS